MDKTLVSILGGLGGMFGWGISDFFANLSSDKIGHTKTFFWSQVAGLIFILLLLPVFGLDLFFSANYYLLVIAASLFYACGYLFFYKAFEIGNVTVVSATINLNVVIAMLLAFLFLGQKLTPIQLFAVILVILGVTLVSINLKDLKKGLNLMSGVKETLMASVFFAVFWNLSQIISENIGWLATSLFVKIFAIVLLFGFSKFASKELSLKDSVNKTKFIVFLVGVLEALAIVSVNYGLNFGYLILVSPISSALSIVTIIMAIIFLKERISKIQALGIFTAIIGIVLTAF
jgi:bacterial/archaeal transporter family protein